MHVYTLYKFRIFVVTCIVVVSFLSSVLVLHLDYLSEESKLASIQVYFVKSWSDSFLFQNNLDDDYGEYGPSDIIANDEDNASDDDDDSGDVNIFNNGDFDDRSRVNFSLPLKISNPRNSAYKFVAPSPSNLKKIDEKIVSVLKSREGFPYVEDNIYWSQFLENKVPNGFDDKYVGKYLHSLQNEKVVKIEPPSWNRCGRPKNQFVTLSNGRRACARYRHPHDYLVHGEVLSFYLSRLLGIQNVPIVALSLLSNSSQWTLPVVKRGMRLAGWKRNAIVALIEWIDNLERSRIPRLVLDSLKVSSPISYRTEQLATLRLTELVEIVQWSDLIVFDYIIGHYDRVASMQDAAVKERRMMTLHESVHNLAKCRIDDGLWFIDNESGILDGYTLMYSGNSKQSAAADDSGPMFVRFHEQMLNTVCIFRRSTVERVCWLHDTDDPLKTLVDFASLYEKYLEKSLIYANEKLVHYFGERVGNVCKKMRSCNDS